MHVVHHQRIAHPLGEGVGGISELGRDAGVCEPPVRFEMHARGVGGLKVLLGCGTSFGRIRGGGHSVPMRLTLFDHCEPLHAGGSQWVAMFAHALQTARHVGVIVVVHPIIHACFPLG